jgi:branched-chain amino acid transport system permease protein
MPDLWPFVISGLAFGGVYALSGAGLVVLYRTTAVVNFAYGAFGALAALIAWQLMQDGVSQWGAVIVAVAAVTVLSALYGAVVNPRLARQGPEIAAAGSLGVSLILLGACTLIWGDGTVRTLNLSTSNDTFTLGTTVVTLTQVIALALGLALVLFATIYLRRTLSGTTMRALAEDRQLSSLLGVRVHRVATLTWTVVGLLSGITGILFANLLSLQAELLTFLVISSLAAAIIGRLRSLWMTVAGGLLVGLVQSVATAYPTVAAYQDAAPFVIAGIALLILDLVRPTQLRRA